MKLTLDKLIVAVAADFGTVLLSCIGVFSSVVAVLEFFRPGIVASAVAPQAVAVFAALALGLALLNDESPKRSLLAKAGYFLAELAVTGFAFWGAWYYFSSVPEVRSWLMWGIGLTVAALLASASKPVPEGV